MSTPKKSKPPKTPETPTPPLRWEYLSADEQKRWEHARHMPWVLPFLAELKRPKTEADMKAEQARIAYLHQKMGRLIRRKSGEWRPMSASKKKT